MSWRRKEQGTCPAGARRFPLAAALHGIGDCADARRNRDAARARYDHDIMRDALRGTRTCSTLAPMRVPGTTASTTYRTDG
jgi:hypothetical protein